MRSNTYRIAVQTLENNYTSSLSEDEFDELVSIRRVIFASTEFEETFNLLVHNWIDFQKAIFDLTITRAIRYDFSWDDGAEMRSILDQKLTAFLTSARLYVEQTPRELKNEFEDGQKLADDFKKTLSNQYDTRNGYAFMEALRNYVQHKGLPVHSLTFENKRDPVEGADLNHALLVYAKTERLKEDKKFKKAVFDRFEEVPDRIELTEQLNDYMTGLMKAQIGLRKLLEDHIRKAKDLFMNYGHRVAGSQFDGAFSIEVKKISKDAKQESFLLSKDLLKRRAKLSKVNSFVGEIASIKIVN